jgi:hypothetical protein
MSRIPLKYHTNVLFYTKYTHPTLICRGTDARTDGRAHGRTDGRTENIYSIFRDKLLLLGEHGFNCGEALQLTSLSERKNKNITSTIIRAPLGARAYP